MASPPPRPFDLHPESGLPMCIEEPQPFMAKLDAVRAAYRTLRDLEESVNDLVCGLTAIPDDFSCTYILLRAFQRRQGVEDTVSDPEKATVQP